MRGDFSFHFMTLLVILTASVWWAFCIAYHLRSKWWKNPYGRNLMSVGAAIAALHTLLAFYAISDQWTPALTLVATALLLWSLYSAGRRIYLMDNVQKSDVERR